ncbi:RNA polymerase subunit sigma-70 [Nonomuraea typhae]|uniref:RNA polymerase sigma factor n=1 Tax=Nonomuraea typhae TaxID=2603600 RepID=A0ABW7YU35_9ACTN
MTARNGNVIEVDAVMAGDEDAFTQLVEQYQREMQVHCYRMLGSLEESEDLAQETFLRAWRARESFRGQSTVRAWLYKIATNACLDFLDRQRRRPRPRDLSEGKGAPAEIAWLQPYPDRLLGFGATGADEPDAAVIRKETIELAFLAAIQHLSARQRAVLILRDVLDWSAKETAAQLDSSVESVKSALKRARSILRDRLPQQRLGWSSSTAPTTTERELLQRFMDAHDEGDATAFAALLSDDVRMTMPPLPHWFVGRAAVEAFAAQAFGPGSPLHGGRWRSVITRANLQPAVAGYLRVPDEAEYRAQALNVLRIEHGQIVEITVFEPRLFAAFGLPPVWPEDSSEDGAPFSQTSPSQ